MLNKPSFLITIDTEGDNLWSRPNEITTKNATFIPRFQELCEKYNLKPTYLTNYEMVKSKQFQEFGKDIIMREVGEIGMHLHAWDTPPSYRLTDNDNKFHPYLIEYPEKIMREKIAFMTDLLEDTFEIKMLSHRGGRWSFDNRYAKMLIKKGYKIDCTVTPNVSWENNLGDPTQNGGINYTKFPNHTYFINTSDISLEGNSSLLEVPLTVEKTANFVWGRVLSYIEKYPALDMVYNIFPKRAKRVRLRPNGRNLEEMLKLLDNLQQSKRDYVQFMLHSSELMPGGSPFFPTERSIEKLYKDLDRLFVTSKFHFEGCTLKEYYEKHTSGMKL